MDIIALIKKTEGLQQNQAEASLIFDAKHWNQEQCAEFLKKHGIETEGAPQITDEALTYKTKPAAPQLFEINDVEIFRTGKWNGDDYTEKDLDDIVAAFEKVGYKPPVKLGHKESSGAPAFGWVRSLRRKGDKLVADFMDLPQKIYEAIKARRFDSVSSEIFWNLKRGDQTFRRALKAVALLGSEIPAVADLKPLRDSLHSVPDIEAHVYTISDEDMKMDVKELQAKVDELTKLNTQLQAKLDAGGDKGNDEEVKKLQQQVSDLTKQIAQGQQEKREQLVKNLCEKIRVPAYREYFEPMIRIFAGQDDLATKTYSIGTGDAKQDNLGIADVVEAFIDRLNKDTEKLFAQLSVQTFEDLPEEPETGDEFKSLTEVSDKIEELVAKYQKDHRDADYGEAVNAVLQANPKLAKAYNQG